MPIVFHDGLSFSGVPWTFNLPPVNAQRPAYGMCGHSPVHFRDQQIIS